MRSVLPPVQTARAALWCAAAGLGGYGGLSMAGQSQWAYPAATVGALATLQQVVRGRRLQERRVLAIGIIGGLSPLLGLRQLEPQTVRLSRWTRGRYPVPGRVDVRYYPGIDSSGLWRTELARVVSAKTGRPYAVGRDWPRQSRIRLVLDTSPAATNAPPPAHRRLSKSITDLIGPTAQVGKIDVDDSGAITGFQVTHQASVKLAAGGYRARVERTISATMPGRWRAHWDLEKDTARFEVRPTLPKQLWLPVTDAPGPNALANYRDVAIPYAVDEDDRQICWRPGVVPHFLFTGQTGTGKTSTALVVISGVTRAGWAMWIADVKRIEFRAFREWPNVQVVASSIPQIVAMIHQAWRVMMERYSLVESGRAKISDFEPLFVLIDEYTEFLNSLRSWYASVKVRGDASVPRTLDEIASILRLGRSGRVHLVITAQRPDVALFGGAAAGEMRDNLGQRMSLGRLSPSGALMMWENASVGVSIPRGLVGRGTTFDADGRPVEVQAYRFPDLDAPAGGEEAALLGQLRPARSVHDRLLILDPELPDSEAGLTWSAYAETRWVTAREVPDLDPLNHPGESVDGRVAGSALGVLGLVSSAQPDPAIGMGAVIPLPDRAGFGVVDDEGDHAGGSVAQLWPDEGDGYDEESTSCPERLAPGDLLRLEDGLWVVVDEEPVEDPLEPGCWVISWRDDSDDAGIVSMPDGESVTVRLPLREDGEGVQW